MTPSSAQPPVGLAGQPTILRSPEPLCTAGDPGAATTQQHTYEVNYDRVWAACVQVASQKYTISNSDKASGIMSFHTGENWHPSSDTELGVTVIRVSDTETSVTVHAQYTKMHLGSRLGTYATHYLNDVGDNLSR